MALTPAQIKKVATIVDRILPTLAHLDQVAWETHPTLLKVRELQKTLEEELTLAEAQLANIQKQRELLEYIIKEERRAVYN